MTEKQIGILKSLAEAADLIHENAVGIWTGHAKAVEDMKEYSKKREELEEEMESLDEVADLAQRIKEIIAVYVGQEG